MKHAFLLYKVTKILSQKDPGVCKHCTVYDPAVFEITDVLEEVFRQTDIIITLQI